MSDPIPFRVARHPERTIMDKVQALLGQRCHYESDDDGCVLGTDRDTDGRTFQVVFHAETRDARFPFVAYDMCNACVIDVRCSPLREHLSKIETVRRASSDNKGETR